MTRFKLSFLLLVTCFLVIVYQLFKIQVLNSNRLLQEQSYLSVDREPPLRGEIYAQDEKPLAINRKVYEVYANIALLKKFPEIQKTIKETLQIKDSTLSAYLRKSNWQKIKTEVVEGQRQKLLKYYPTYLNFEEYWSRYYPEGSSSAQILGFVGKNEVGEAKGYAGVEGYFDRELRGLPKVSENETDLFGIPFIGGVYDDNTQANSGMDIYLTIDINVQKIVEKRLKTGLKKYKAKKACAIVMEPQSGKIIALSCLPSFDPKKYYQFTDEDFNNPAISTVYEPGSTFKPLVVAMGLSEKKITPKTILPETGPYEIGQYFIRTWDNQYRGKINVADILAKSSNVGMVEIIQKLKKSKVNSYLQKLGLFEITGIELEGEANSLIKDLFYWQKLDYLTASFGQGFAITPIQLVRAFAALANNGYLIKPTLVDKIVDPKTGQSIPKLENQATTLVFPTTIIKQMKELLRYDVDKAEAYWPNKLPNYSYCGKTGTAQIAVEGKYDVSKTNASFIGFMPCDNPKFLALVLYYQPETSPWGSETAAPSFFDIAHDLILYYNIAPEYVAAN